MISQLPLVRIHLRNKAPRLASIRTPLNGVRLRAICDVFHAPREEHLPFTRTPNDGIVLRSQPANLRRHLVHHDPNDWRVSRFRNKDLFSTLVLGGGAQTDIAIVERQLDWKLLRFALDESTPVARSAVEGPDTVGLNARGVEHVRIEVNPHWHGVRSRDDAAGAGRQTRGDNGQLLFEIQQPGARLIVTASNVLACTTDADQHDQNHAAELPENPLAPEHGA